jgi:hypothetical protein
MSTRKLLLLTCLCAPLSALPATMVYADDNMPADNTLHDRDHDVIGVEDALTLQDDTLATLDGMADTSLAVLFNDNHQEAGISGNQLQSASTGTNLLGQGIFAGSNGISTVIQNTGNQVLIQQTTQVNVLFRP